MDGEPLADGVIRRGGDGAVHRVVVTLHAADAAKAV